MTTLIAWAMSVHLVGLLTWSAGLFALPALYAAYPNIHDSRSRQRLRGMARFTFIAIASPAAVITIVAGTVLIHPTGAYEGWLVLKLGLVALMALFHIVCGRLVVVLHHKPSFWPAGAHLALIAVPAILISCILWLVLAKPL